MPTELDLVRAAQGGDQGALDALFRDHYQRIHALCRRFARDPTDALDLTQDAVVAILRGLPSFDGQSAFSTWAFRVTTNACLQELRRRSRRPPPDPGGNEPDQQMSTDIPVGDRVAAHLDADALLAALPDDYRAAVILRDVLDLEYAEIAVILEVPIGTVRSRIARGRAMAARLLDGAAAGNRSARPGIEPDDRTSPGAP